MSKRSGCRLVGYPPFLPGTRRVATERQLGYLSALLEEKGRPPLTATERARLSVAGATDLIVKLTT